MAADIKTVQALVEAARLLGATQAKKGFGCYTEQDSRFEVAMHKSISSHTNALIAQMQREAVQPGWKLVPTEPTEEWISRIADMLISYPEQLRRHTAKHWILAALHHAPTMNEEE